MRCCRALLTAVTVLLMSVIVAGPASAGGPTSVVLVEPESFTSAGLYYSNVEYGKLARLVGGDGGGGMAGDVDRSGSSHESGPGVTLTWLLHDVAVWRVDRVYLEAKGGPWIATQLVANPSGNVHDVPVVWHTAADGAELTALLARLGFGPNAKRTPRGDVEIIGTEPPPSPAPAAERVASPQTSRDTSNTPGLAWGLAGLSLGVALTVAALRLLPLARPATAQAGPEDAARPDTSGPADPEPLVQAEAEMGWSTADELTWPGDQDSATRPARSRPLASTTSGSSSAPQSSPRNR